MALFRDEGDAESPSQPTSTWCKIYERKPVAKIKYNFITHQKVRRLRHCLGSEEKTYWEQTGRFPYTSYRLNQYVMVMVELDSSTILLEAIKNWTVEEMKRVYLKLLSRVIQSRALPQKNIMDNNISEVLWEMIEQECKLELVPAGCHPRNVAKVAVRTIKNHTIVIFQALRICFHS